MEERVTFTFFRSFYEAASCLGDKAQQADFYNALCAYALDGKQPELDGVAAALFLLAKPNIDAGRRKAENGACGGSKPKAKAKQTESKTEANGKQSESKTEANAKQTASNKEKDKEKEEGIGSNNPQTPKGDAFERFWSAYPKKVGKEAARKAFGKVKVPVESLLTAIERQKCGNQWSAENGRFIPNPATWLNQGRWEDEVVLAAGKAPVVEQKSAGENLARMRAYAERMKREV